GDAQQSCEISAWQDHSTANRRQTGLDGLCCAFYHSSLFWTRSALVMDTAPYISIVVTSRNDNHGDKLLFRMQTFVDCLLDQCKRYQLPAELVMVEWNPPDDQAPLAQALSWPRDRNCSVRVIQVPPDIHQRFE